MILKLQIKMAKIKAIVANIIRVLTALLQLIISLTLFITWLGFLFKDLQDKSLLMQIVILSALFVMVGGPTKLVTAYNALAMSYFSIIIFKLSSLIVGSSILQLINPVSIFGLLIIHLMYPLPVHKIIATHAPKHNIKPLFSQYIALGCIMCNLLLFYPLGAYGIVHGTALGAQLISGMSVCTSLLLISPMVVKVGHKTFWNYNFGPLKFVYVAAMRSLTKPTVHIRLTTFGVVRLILLLFALCPSIAYAATDSNAGPVAESMLGRVSVAVTKQVSWFGNLCCKCNSRFFQGFEQAAPEAFEAAGAKVGRALPTLVSGAAAATIDEYAGLNIRTGAVSMTTDVCNSTFKQLSAMINSPSDGLQAPAPQTMDYVAPNNSAPNMTTTQSVPSTSAAQSVPSTSAAQSVPSTSATKCNT